MGNGCTANKATWTQGNTPGTVPSSTSSNPLLWSTSAPTRELHFASSTIANNSAKLISAIQIKNPIERGITDDDEEVLNPSENSKSSVSRKRHCNQIGSRKLGTREADGRGPIYNEIFFATHIASHIATLFRRASQWSRIEVRLEMK
jgi:hypothetical protein